MEQAIQDIKWLSDRLSGIIELGPQLEKIGSLENHERELTSRVESLKEEVSQHEDEIKSLVSDKEKSYADLSDEVKASKDKVKDILAKAEAQALSITEEAHTAVEALLAEAAMKKSDLVQDILALQTQKMNESNLVEAQKKELAELNQTIESLKAKFN